MVIVNLTVSGLQENNKQIIDLKDEHLSKINMNNYTIEEGEFQVADENYPYWVDYNLIWVEDDI